MNSIQFQKPNNLAYKFETLSKKTTSWKEENITFSKLNHLLKMHLRLIFSQTGKPFTAPRLQNAMLALSDRITKEFGHMSDGITLAYQLTCQAYGIYSRKKIYLEKIMPPELLLNIFSEIPPKNSQEDRSNLLNIALVSKSWKKLAIIAKRDWAGKASIPLSTFGFSGTKALQYALDNNLSSANLSGNGYVLNTGNPLKTPKMYPRLKHLNLSGWVHFNSVRLPFPNLISLDLSFCSILKENNLARILEQLICLEILILHGCKNITGIHLENILENRKYLKKLDISSSGILILGLLTQIEDLNFELCKQIPENDIERTLLNAPYLRNLNLNYCMQITEQTFKKIIKTHSKLNSLSIEGLLLSRTKYQALKGHPNIKHLELGNCKIDKSKQFIHFLFSFPKLINLNLASLERPEEDLIKLLNDLHNLETLDLENWKHNSGKLLAKGREYPNIRNLNLSYWQITKSMWLQVLSKFPNLNILNLSYANISIEEKKELLNALPDLQILH